MLQLHITSYITYKTTGAIADTRVLVIYDVNGTDVPVVPALVWQCFPVFRSSITVQ